MLLSICSENMQASAAIPCRTFLCLCQLLALVVIWVMSVLRTTVLYCMCCTVLYLQYEIVLLYTSQINSQQAACKTKETARSSVTHS
jgi:hypothetical protein